MQQNKVGELKLFRLFGLSSLIYLFLASTLFAKSFEDFKHAESAAFKKYNDKNDLAFASYLKDAWEEYSVKVSPSLYKKQKPKSITPSREIKIKNIGPRVNIKIPEIKKQVIIPIKLEVVKKDTKDIYINYFGQEIGFSIDSNIRDAHFYPQNQAGILNFFNRMASSDYKQTIYEINEACRTLKLNDWGVYQLVNQLSKTLYSSSDSRKLYAWFIFNKLGYEVKIGLGRKHVVLMHYSKKIIYSTPSYSFADKKFYVISAYAKASLGNIYTYNQTYPNAHKALDLELRELPNFKKNLMYKTVSFTQFGKEYSSTFSYDKNLIDFMGTYPQADYETYFNAPMSSLAYNQIASDIKKYINNKHSSYAINFVLNFVQKAFKYETDQQQFGREKVMFANETLYYEKSDCEDRAILFAYLVKKLFKISVIGVKYKDHMATALYIPMQGDSVRKGSKRYIIADPTYINANIGQSMPKYRSVIPQSYITVSKGS